MLLSDSRRTTNCAWTLIGLSKSLCARLPGARHTTARPPPPPGRRAPYQTTQSGGAARERPWSPRGERHLLHQTRPHAQLPMGLLVALFLLHAIAGGWSPGEGRRRAPAGQLRAAAAGRAAAPLPNLDPAPPCSLRVQAAKPSCCSPVATACASLGASAAACRKASRAAGDKRRRPPDRSMSCAAFMHHALQPAHQPCSAPCPPEPPAGLLSSYACASGIQRVTVINRQQPSTEWRIQPVQAGALSIGAATRVHLVVGGRGGQGGSSGKPWRAAAAEQTRRWQPQVPTAACRAVPPVPRMQATGRAGCGTAYATWPAACAPGVVILTAAGAAPARQQWVAEPWGATWRLRPASCPGKYLSFHATNCAGIYGQVQPVMANFSSAFSLYSAADGALVKPPAGSQPGVPPQPQPSPAPPSPSPPPPQPSPVPSPPPPSPSPPPPLPPPPSPPTGPPSGG